jgi:hypothetical protein
MATALRRRRDLSGPGAKRVVGLVWLPGDGVMNVEEMEGFSGYEYHGTEQHAVGSRP